MSLKLARKVSFVVLLTLDDCQNVIATSDNYLRKEKILKIKKETALELWVERNGSKTRVQDYSDRTMDKSAYGLQSSEYGWDIDHIRPESLGGGNNKGNLEICTIKTNQEKADNFPHWTANGKRFKAVKVKRNCYKIIED
jgi:CRISPR/Cas system Type II protein with McrA/HNH and RuvC-like nuclease domain